MLMFDNVASETSPCTFHTASALSFISFLYFTNHEALSSHITLASYIYQAHINFFPDESVYPKKVAYQTKQTISFALHFLHPLSSISFLFIFHLSWGDSFIPLNTLRQTMHSILPIFSRLYSSFTYTSLNSECLFHPQQLILTLSSTCLPLSLQVNLSRKSDI